MEGNRKLEYYEDEIELIDYLRVIWKRKWLIIVGMLLCGLAAAIYGFTRHDAKMYKISAFIEIDPLVIKSLSANKTKTMIEYGILNPQIMKDLSKLQGISKPENLRFEVTVPAGLNILDVGYKTPEVNQGKMVLNSLIEQLGQQFKGEIEQASYQSNSKIAQLKSQIRDIQSKIQLIEKRYDNSVNIKKRKVGLHKANIELLKGKIDIVNDTIEMIKSVLKEAELSRDRLIAHIEGVGLGTHGEMDYVEMLKQTSAIRQIVNYPIELRNQIKSLALNEKDFLREIFREENTIKDLGAQIESLRMNRDSDLRAEHERIKGVKAKSGLSEIRTEQSIAVDEKGIHELTSESVPIKREEDKILGVRLKQPMTVSPVTAKPKTKSNVLLATIVGLFLMLFLAFFLEYIQKHKGEPGS